MTNFKIILVVTFVVSGVAASLLIRHQTQVGFHENEAVLRQQDIQLADLAAEHQRLSDLVAGAKTSPSVSQMGDIAKLRSEAEALRKQTNALGRQLAMNSSSTTQSAPKQDYPDEYYAQLNKLSSGKTKDAHTLSVVIENYALEHNGEFPTTLDQVAPYLRKRHMSLTGTNEFEIVYQGSLNDLSNIPLRTVWVVRERRPWLAPSGKWARVYCPVADGFGEVVESDDNFQSWEAEHIIPPPTAK